MTQLSTDLTALIAEAIGLPKDAFERFFEGIGESQSGTQRQDKLKLVKYPDMRELGMEGDAAQGGMYRNPQAEGVHDADDTTVGPHKGSY
jgi:isopenicillin N synthase-like dioxygenase